MTPDVPLKRDVQAILDMIKAGELVVQFAKRGKKAFQEDVMMQSAIERQFEIMGEAATRVSQGFRDAHATIPWRTIIAFRNTLIHGYDAVVPEKVWGIIGGSLRAALEELRKLTK